MRFLFYFLSFEVLHALIHSFKQSLCEGPTWSPHVSGIRPTGFREWAQKMRAIVSERKNEVLFSSQKHSQKKTTFQKKTMFSHNQILINSKSYGFVHDVCVKKICVCCTCLQMHWFKLLTAVSAVLSQIIEPTTYPKTRFCFGRLGYTLLECIIVIVIFIYYYYYYYYYYYCYYYYYFNAWHSLPQCPFMLSHSFHNPYAISMQFHT